MIVYSNSDSYGVVSDGKVYSDFIAERLDATLINSGRSGACNQRILRTTVRDLIDLKKQHEDVLVLVGLAPMHRYEYWAKINKYPEDNDGHFVSFQIGSLTDPNNFYDNDIKNFAKEWFLQSDYEGIVTNLYYELTLLVNFLESNNFKYLIWSGPRELYNEIDTQSPFLKNFYQETKEKIIDFNKFSFCRYCLDQGFVPIDHEKYDNHGHHGESAHESFADYLLTNYIK